MAVSSGEYLAAMQRALGDGGYEPLPDAAAPGMVLVGYRSDFRWRWFASRLHLFVTAATVTVATAADLHRFADDSLALAKARKGRLRGMQTGVAAIPVMVADAVQPDAVEFAQTRRVANFAAFAWPVLVDLQHGAVASLQRSPRVGALFNGWMREQIAAVCPRPQ